MNFTWNFFPRIEIRCIIFQWENLQHPWILSSVGKWFVFLFPQNSIDERSTHYPFRILLFHLLFISNFYLPIYQLTSLTFSVFFEWIAIWIHLRILKFTKFNSYIINKRKMLTEKKTHLVGRLKWSKIKNKKLKWHSL